MLVKETSCDKQLPQAIDASSRFNKLITVNEIKSILTERNVIHNNLDIILKIRERWMG